MPTLYLRLKSGKIVSGKYPLHAILMDEKNINYEDIIDCGVRVRNRIIWQHRKPH